MRAMNILTRILSGAALAAALAMPAAAETSPVDESMPNGSMVIIWPDGTMAHVHILNSGMVASAMQQATQTTKPTILIVENGHAFLVPDRQMADGKMMSDSMSDTSTPGITSDTQPSGAATQPSGAAKQ
jgi:hypothetical protein